MTALRHIFLKRFAGLVWSVCVVLCLAMLSHADEYIQGFENWPFVPTAVQGDYNLDAGWNISSGSVWSVDETGLPADAGGGTWYGVLHPYPSEGTNSSIRGPLRNVGIGKVTFIVCNDSAINATLILQVSSNATGPWTTRNSLVYGLDAWNPRSFMVNYYGTNVYFRIWKASGETYTLIDNLQVTNPPARVDFSDTSTWSLPALAGKPIDLTSKVLQQGLVSDLTVTSYWKSATSSWAAISMSLVSGTVYKTSAPIPGHPAGTIIQYYIRAIFSGNSAISPTNDPSSGPVAPYTFTFINPPFASDYESMMVTGDVVRTMTMISNRTWQAIVPTPLPTNTQFRFSGLHTNSSTQLWGKPALNGMNLPIMDVASDGGPASIQVNGHPGDALAIRFNESNRVFSVRPSVFEDFLNWSTTNFANLTNNQWIASSAWFRIDNARQWRDRACYLSSNNTSFIRTPPLSDGIGEISFWYRNWNQAGSPAGEFYVQKSPTGGSAPGEWTTITTVSGISTTGYTRFTHAINDRANSYVRILNSTNPAARANLCLDEILVTCAGADIAVSNVLLNPAAPTLIQPAFVSAAFGTRGGATNLDAQTWWRFGTSGVFTAIGMTNNDLGVYTTSNTIPASDGSDGNTMQYYLFCSFDGLENFSSPLYYPIGGAANPTSYVARPAVTFTNLVRVPNNPSNQPVNLSIKIIPSEGTTNRVVTLWFRPTTNVAFTALPMTYLGGDIYQTATPIPRYPVGTMQYYFECSYQGVGNPFTVSSFYPDEAAMSPLTYVLADSWIEQNFNTWNGAPTWTAPDQPDFSNWTDRGWVVWDGQVGTAIEPPFNLQPRSTPYAAFLNMWDSYSGLTNIFIRSLKITNDIGSIRFYAQNDALGNIGYAIDRSLDGTNNWTRLTNWIFSGVSTWSPQFHFLNLTNTPLFLRIAKISDNVGTVSGIDDIRITRQPARVQISAVITDPGYPHNYGDVTVSCTIESITPSVPAFDIKGVLYWRRIGDPTFTDIEMTQDGTRFAAVIPGQEVNARVEYYIKATFQGYNHFTEENHSPCFYPAGPTGQSTNQYFIPPTTGFPNYTVRSYASQYSSLVVTSSVGAVTMNLIGSNWWQGLLAVTTPRTSLTWSVWGYAQYTNGATAYGTNTVMWGDPDQTRYVLPFTTTGGPSSQPIQIHWPFSGSNYVVFRYNTDDNTYIAKECSYQDFNQWDASPTFFMESLGVIGISKKSNKFDLWPSNGVRTIFENCETWNTNSTYWEIWGDGRGYRVNDILAYRDMKLNKALQFKNSDNQGRAWPIEFILPDGLDTFSFKYRVRAEDFYYTRCTVGSNWSGYMVECDINGIELSPDPEISLFARFGSDTVNYEMRSSIQAGYPNNLTVRLLKNSSGTTSLNTMNIGSRTLSGIHKYTMIVATNNQQPVSPFTQWGYLRTAHDNSWMGEVFPSGANLLPGPGTIAINSKGAAIAVDNVKVTTIANLQTFYWLGPTTWTRQSYTNTQSGWAIINGGVNGHTYGVFYTNNGGGYVRTPYLPYNISKLTYQPLFYNIPDRTLTVDGSSNGTDWAELDRFTDSGSGAWRNRSIEHNPPTLDLNPYRYFRIRAASTNATGAPNGGWALLVDNIFIYPENPILLDEKFSTPVATNWYAPQNNWNVTNGLYRRPGYFGPGVEIKIMKAVTNDWIAPGDPNPANWTPVRTFTATNVAYRTTNYVFESAETIFPGIFHGTTAVSIVVDDISMNSWNATNYTDVNGWIARQILITDRAPLNKQLELWRKRAYVGLDQYVQTPTMSNGISMVGFEAKVDNPPATVLVQVATSPTSSVFFTTNTITLTNLEWEVFQFPIFYTNKTPVRLVHSTSNRDTTLYLDNVEVADYVERDERTWYAYNALITDRQDLREFEAFPYTKTAYLNNLAGGFGANTPPGVTYSADNAYIQTPRLRRGIGEISFWYRNWEQDGDPFTTITLKSSPYWLAPKETWSNVLVIANVTNTKYQYFTTNLYIGEHQYLRFYCTTNPYSRVALDNILVAQPVGSDFEIARLRLIPEAPVFSNTVRITTEINAFLLSPQNIQARAYYHVGTNPWTSWPATNYLLLDQVETNGSMVRYTSTASIPTQLIDQAVQYKLRFTFSGVFSDKASPKWHREFETPSWYYPVNLNQQYGATNPYYFALSCVTGSVWVNEFNYKYGFTAVDTEFVELCGQAGANVTNWRIHLVDSTNQVYGDYPLNIHHFTETTNGYGFWVLGDAELGGLVNRVLTNTTYSGGHIWTPGSLRVIRGMGAYADYVSYGNWVPPPADSTYAGKKNDSFIDASVSLVGTNNVASGFDWLVDWRDISPGAMNEDQLLVRPGDPLPDPPIPPLLIEITRIWMLNSNAWIRFTLDGGRIPIPRVWYSTNIIQTNWSAISPLGGFTNSGVYTQWFGIPTTQRQHFYRVTATNTPW